jgi:pimeloyl-ACP methyl ester carboxylesterase
VTGELTVTVRGTELEVGDILADVILASGVLARLNPQYIALKTQMDKWMQDPSILDKQSFTVTGHSLGGYLAEAINQTYPNEVTTAYLYNTPGSSGLVGNILNLVSGLFTRSAPGDNNVYNVKGSEGLSLIAGLGHQSSGVIAVQSRIADPVGWAGSRKSGSVALNFCARGLPLPCHCTHE